MKSLALRRKAWSARYAAVDIGSNAVRMLIADVIRRRDKLYFREQSRMRVPLRLGREVFQDKRLSRRTAAQVVRVLKAFRDLQSVFAVDEALGCATSAVREAANGASLIRSIRAEAGLNLHVISGTEEADLIFSSFVAQSAEPHRPYMLFDLGGGSTEVAFYREGRSVAAQSFAVGAVRGLGRRTSRTEWKRMGRWVSRMAADHGGLAWQVVGSGGNVKDLLRLAGKKSDKPLSLKKLLSLRRTLRRLPVERRIHDLKLGYDRADVIVPATDIIVHLLQSAAASRLYGPRIGLLEGIISRIYMEHHPSASPTRPLPAWL